jgi:hypothetical protein
MEAKLTRPIPKFLKIEAKRTLLIEELKKISAFSRYKIEAKQTQHIQELKQIETKGTLLIEELKKISGWRSREILQEYSNLYASYVMRKSAKSL